MHPDLTVGLCREGRHLVLPEMRPPHLEGILATSRMIGLVEDTCLDAIQPLLDGGKTTVGTHVHLSHVGVARTGEEIRIRIRLIKITRRRLLTFEVEVRAPGGVICSGTHQRLIVDRDHVERRSGEGG